MKINKRKSDRNEWMQWTGAHAATLHTYRWLRKPVYESILLISIQFSTIIWKNCQVEFLSFRIGTFEVERQLTSTRSSKRHRNCFRSEPRPNTTPSWWCASATSHRITTPRASDHQAWNFFSFSSKTSFNFWSIDLHFNFYLFFLLIRNSSGKKSRHTEKNRKNHSRKWP